jgi:hypothetical protein
LQEELARLRLRIQPAKTGIVNLKHGEGFDFLGFHQRWVAAQRRPGVHFLARWPSRRAMARARTRIRELTARSQLRRPITAVVAELNRFLIGWRGYFRHGNSAASFDALEYFLTERLVLFISKKHQRRGRWFRPPRAVRLPEPARAGHPRRNRVGTETEPLAVKHDGEPDEGEPHVRFDGRELETEHPDHGQQKNDPTGNRPVHAATRPTARPRHRASSRPNQPRSSPQTW